MYNSGFISPQKVRPFDASVVFDGNSFIFSQLDVESFRPLIKTDSINYATGGRYKGSIFDGMRHGKGVFRDADGNELSGQFDHDHIIGIGIYKRVDGSRYEGEFQNDAENGEGKETWPDGSFYIGTFKNGLKEGHGKYRFPDGSVYVGNFKEGYMSGEVV